jgi:glycosyltransferase involved in cell wall biosynthesis
MWLLPNRLYEAVAAGIPVIAVDGTATGEVVRHFNIGIVMPECSPEAVVHALETCSQKKYEMWLTNIYGLKYRAVRRNEWTLVFDEVSRWDDLKRLPREIDVGVVFRADATQ